MPNALEPLMSEFLGRLRNGVTRCCLDRENCRILVAVSGGPDSVALLRGLVEIALTTPLQLHAAHLNHALRGDDSNSDAAWLEALAKKLRVPMVVAEADIRAQSVERKAGLEETARAARYDFLQRTASPIGCTHIVTAHNSDDQAETILHHIVRGTGLSGLSGMSRSRSLGTNLILARPMLDIDRPTIIDYLNEIGQDYRIDASNADESFTRNRIRHSLLPNLERQFNPQVRTALLRLGTQAAETQAVIDQLALPLLESSIQERQPSCVRIDCSKLRDEPAQLVRAGFVQLWKQQNWPLQRMGFADWNRLLDVLHDGLATTLPGGIDARRRKHELVITRPEDDR
jgi:tRNA(Ile)-lysidine synthase